MLIDRIASRWAKALYEMTEELGKTDPMKQEVEDFLTLLNESKALQLFFRSPAIPKEKKLKVFEKSFQNKMDELLYRYIRKLIQHHREDILHAILKAYVDYYYAQKGIVIARVESAISLNEEEKEKLRSRLKAFLGSEVLLEEKIKPSLIGGFRVFVGDKLLDETILHKLNELRKRFSLQPFIEVI
jgi:ATP synthase F1 delta subunit